MADAGTSSNTLFVGRIDATTRQQDIEELFAKYGKLRRCFVKDKGPQSYAFVTFEDPADADKAFNEIQGYELNGQKINVEKARSSDRSSRGPGGGAGPRGPPRGAPPYGQYPPGPPYGHYPPPPPHSYYPPYPYDPRAAHYPPPPVSAPRAGYHSRRSRSRSPPRSGAYPPAAYDYHGRGNGGGYDYPTHYPPADSAAAYGPPAAYGHDPYAASFYPGYGQAAPYGAPGPYPSRSSRSPRSPVRSDRGARGARDADREADRGAAAHAGGSNGDAGESGVTEAAYAASGEAYQPA